MSSQKKIIKAPSLLFSAGLGVEYSSSPSYTDYLRSELSTGTGDSIKTFSTGVEFFGCLEYAFAKTFSAKVDYSYYLRSDHYDFGYYVFDYTIKSHQPYLMFFYDNRAKQFSFKFGAGAGYLFQVLENSITPSNSLTYTSHGLSLKGEAVFAPRFSESLETYISVFLFGSTTTSLKDDNGNLLKGSATGNEVNLRSYGVGARLGLSFYLN